MTSNRDGAGARVVVHRTERLHMMREVWAGNSYQSSRTKDVFFGLSSADVAQMTAHRPSGIVDTVRFGPFRPISP